MPKRKKIDATALVKAVEEGMKSTEIMAKFDLKTLAQLKGCYVEALAEKGMVKGIVSGRRAKEARAKKTKVLKVNNRGSLVIPREMIQEMDFSVGESFSVHKSLIGVSLKKN